MTIIYLTRHGQTQWNAQKRMQGQCNSALTQEGEEQAKNLGKYFKNIDIDIIYCSTLGRAKQTADLIKGNRNLPIEYREDLKEIALGDWEGKEFSEIEEKYPQQNADFWHKPEAYHPVGRGETYEQLRQRAGNALKEIATKNKNKTVLVVTHGTLLETLETYFRRQPISEMVNGTHPHSCCLCEVRYAEPVWDVMKWNEDVQNKQKE